MQALRRDVALLGGRGAIGGSRMALCSLRVEQASKGSAEPVQGMMDDVLRALVELVPFSLRARDRVYRVAEDELALLLAGTDERGVEVVMARFEADAARVLADRGLPPVLIVHRIFGQAGEADPIHEHGQDPSTIVEQRAG